VSVKTAIIMFAVMMMFFIIMGGIKA